MKKRDIRNKKGKKKIYKKLKVIFETLKEVLLSLLYAV